jgi:glycosyltransferase involved in cell wall biosynthesis
MNLNQLAGNASTKLAFAPARAAGAEPVAHQAAPEQATSRPCVRGKFIFVGGEKLYVRGVTYGTFRPDADGCEFPSPKVVEQDFALMAANGVNALRTYTTPPVWLLDAAQRHGLRVMVGLPVERSFAFFDYRACARSIEEMVRQQVRACVGHPAILCYTIGNEVPAPLVRWHGREKVERFLERLYQAAKEEDPGGLVTYVNYPSTEYLQLPFLDFVCFNVYLESRKRLDAYLASLHNAVGDRPLIMGEMGLDSFRHGEKKQALVLDWQIRVAFADGCAGVFVYSWTDEWFRGGAEVHDWKFGLTDRQRQPKAALTAVREAFAEVPFSPGARWPTISVVVCSYNGARTLRDCCQGLLQLEYPEYQVIIVDDGSTDETSAIVAEYGFDVIRTPNRGLSSARNTGLKAATGEIIAYLDDDAWPDPHWLHYLAAAFLNPACPNYAAMGGPNIAPPEDGPLAHCVAHAPGGPSHVLLTNCKAEHIPGCNMAFRKTALQAIGGFDPQFRVAGDDVDVCWRLQEAGWSLGFSPAAMVWHHRRNSVSAYWKQQAGYGKAEAMLERKWPHKYNIVGHAVWAGRIYGNGLCHLRLRTGRIYHGVWGLAPFQPMHSPPPNLIEWLPMMPEWYFVIATLATLSALGLLWKPLLMAWPALVVAVGAPLVQAGRRAACVSESRTPPVRMSRWKFCVTVAVLHLLQPLARLRGRLKHGRAFWKRQPLTGYALPRRWLANVWTKCSEPTEKRLLAIETFLRENEAIVLRGSEFDRWDLEVSGGLFGSARMSLGAEFHGSARQLLRVRSWPLCSLLSVGLIVFAGALCAVAGHDNAWTTCALLGGTSLLLAARTLQECAAATAAFLAAIRKIEREEKIEEEPVARRVLSLRLGRGSAEPLRSRPLAALAEIVGLASAGRAGAPESCAPVGAPVRVASVVAGGGGAEPARGRLEV